MKTGTVVNCTNLDSVRIEVLGSSRALMLPASCVLSADAVLRQVLLDQEGLSIELTEDDDGNSMWEANCGHMFGYGQTPWQAIIELAEGMEWAT